MTHLLTILQDQMGNQFVGGGLLLMLSGSIIALIRNAPGRIIAWLKSRFTRQILIKEPDPLFDCITYWLNSQERFRQSRFLRASTQLSIDDEGNSPTSTNGGSADRKKMLRVFYSPSHGRHFFAYHGRWLSIGREDKAPGNSRGADGESSGGGKHKAPESYFLEVYGRDDGKILQDLIQEIVEFAMEDNEGVRVYFNSWGHWGCDGYTKMRQLSTVSLPAGTRDRVLADMMEFRMQKAWYRDLGIPWHKGYLLYGLPGTGKTSLAAALAGELDMDIYLMNLSGTGMNDETLQRLMSGVRSGAMVILEDVDCTAPGRDDNTANRVTLSGLLNCLDGILSREGCIIVMTTNRREALDEALIRPGRVDFEMEFGLAVEEQIQDLADRIGISREGLRGGDMTMAEVQKELLNRWKAQRTAAEEILTAG